MEQLQNLDRLVNELRGRILELKRKCDGQLNKLKSDVKSIKSLENELNSIKNGIPSYELKREREFNALKMKYRGHEVKRNGKVKLRARETA